MLSLLFPTRKNTPPPPPAIAVNEAAGRAHALTPEAALAQLAVTGALTQTFYATAETQLAQVVELAAGLPDAFVARAALYARHQAGMKDLPALLVAILAARGSALLVAAFAGAIDNGRQLRAFVRMLRSGTLGRRSLGSRPKRLVRDWLNQASDRALLEAAIGNDPSLADVIRMVHPRAATPEREALYGWLLGRAVDQARLPVAVRDLLAFRAGETAAVPELNFQWLTSQPLVAEQWAAVARSASLNTLRLNLNTLARHGALADADTAQAVAERLANPVQASRARVLPYQWMTAAAALSPEVPDTVRAAVERALENGIAQVPFLDRRVAVLVDVSGSMGSPITGVRRGATSVVRCVDVAGLVAATLLRRSRACHVAAFDTRVHVPGALNAFKATDPVRATAARLAAFGGGGTDVACGLEYLRRERVAAELVVIVSDNESWARNSPGPVARPTKTQEAWAAYRSRYAGARLVCLDLQPYITSQVPDAPDVLNVGGFSDAVFPTIARFVAEGHGTNAANRWVAEIEAVAL